MANSPILWGPASTANNLENQILQANGSLLADNGVKNYITYGNFENGATTGWSLGTTGTLTNGIPTGTPAFGSGAAGTLSIATTLTNVLRGTTSLALISSAATTSGNMLATQAYTIDAADQAKVLTGKFSYKVVSGTVNMAGTSANSFGIACYDVTNSVYLPVVGNFAMTQSSGTGTATVTLQTGSTTASIRFIIYANVITSGAVTLNFDDFYLGPQTAPIGTVVTDWQAFTPTFTGFGTPTSILFFSRRNGSDLEVKGGFTAGTSTAVTAQLGIGFAGGSGNVVIDTAKLQTNRNNIVGMAAYDQGSPNLFTVLAPTTNQSYVNLGLVGTATTTPATGSATVGTGGGATFFFSVPIAGWSSNVQMSSDTDTRVIAANMGLAATSLVMGANAPIKYDTVLTDTTGSYSAATGLYTVSVTGIYRISASNLVGSGTGVSVYASVNGAVSQYMMTSTVGAIFGGSTIFAVKAGDTLSVRPDTACTLASGTAYQTNMSIERLSGPAVIAASETVACEYSSVVTGALNAGVPAFIDFGTKESDSHNVVLGAGNANNVTATSTWRFVAPISGRYHVDAIIGLSIAGGSFLDMYSAIAVNGVAVRMGNNIGLQSTATLTYGYTSGVSGVVRLLAGEYISIIGQQNSSAARSQTGVAYQNRVSIVRVGN